MNIFLMFMLWIFIYTNVCWKNILHQVINPNEWYFTSKFLEEDVETMFIHQIYIIGKKSHDQSREHDWLKDLNAKIPIDYMQSC